MRDHFIFLKMMRDHKEILVIDNELCLEIKNSFFGQNLKSFMIFYMIKDLNH